MLDHLEEAKRLLRDAKYTPAGGGKPYWGIEQVDVAGAYALIAIAEFADKIETDTIQIVDILDKIAEQLERLNDKLDTDIDINAHCSGVVYNTH